METNVIHGAHIMHLFYALMQITAILAVLRQSFASCLGYFKPVEHSRDKGFVYAKTSTCIHIRTYLAKSVSTMLFL
jgi:hypothetical protein